MKHTVTTALVLLVAACKNDTTAPPPPAGLTLADAVVNNNGGTATPAAWTLSATGRTTLSGAGGAVSGPGFGAGSYTLSATGPTGYTAGPWSCTEGVLSVATLTLAAGDTATCSITLDDTPPSLQVSNVVTNDEGGSAQPSDFVVSAQGPTPLSGPGSVASDAAFQQGTYILSETTGASGYSASAWSCSGATVTGGNQVILAIGQVANCTITNNDPTFGPATYYVDNPGDFVITTDVAPAGLSAGDVVTFSPSGGSHVSTAGLVFGSNAFGTIQSAVDAAAGGDRIRVAGGTFAEAVVTTKQLTFLGNQFGSDARQRSPAASETIVSGGVNNSFTVAASDVTIDGIVLQDATTSGARRYGLRLGAGTSGTAVRNCIIQNNHAGLLLANASPTNWTVVEHNVFRNNDQPGPVGGGQAIYSDSATSGGGPKSVLIDGNAFVANPEAIHISVGTHSTPPASNIAISRNQFTDNGRALLAVRVFDSRFTGNEISGGTGDHIAVADVDNLTIAHNILANGAGRALYVVGLTGFEAHNITFEFNSISGFSGPGLAFFGDATGLGVYTGPFHGASNWWGAASGPTIASNPGGTGQTIVDPAGVVTYRPFLTSGVDTQPGVPGFQP